MFFVSLLVRATYCCDLSLETVGEERGPRHGGRTHPRSFTYNPHHRMGWLVSRVHAPEDDGGQGDGCEGGKCELRRG